MSRSWRLRLADQAERDLQAIANWTTENFGLRQAEVYLETVTQAIEALHNGPDIPGARERSEIGPGIRTVHVSRRGRKGRHFVIFRVADEMTIDIVRVLHDSMDLVKHLPDSNDQAH
jgi:toxin ParE1/3/4